MQSLLNHQWHHLDDRAVLGILETSTDRGLDEAEVAARQRRFGANVLERRRGLGWLVRFALQFHSPLVYVLLAATLMTALMREWLDAGVIFGVVLVNAVIGYLQESKAIEAIDALAKRMAIEARVVRRGTAQRVPASSLVPGDVVIVQSGDKVPADLRLLYVRELRVDESALTGESVPVEKKTEPVDRDAVLPDRCNMAYASTLAAYGQGRGVVVATAGQTEIGRISQMLCEVTPLATPLTRKIAAFSRVLLFAILGLAAVAFVAGIAHGQPASEVFMASVALAVGAIPEGLPAAVTAILAIGVARMAQQNALVRRLPAVETLGSTTVICSDKTGTLTQNEMTVQQIFTIQGDYDVVGAGYDPEGRVEARGTAPVAEESVAVHECLLAGLLCNDARLHRAEARWAIDGDPTEGALVVAAAKLGMGDAARTHMPRLDAIPFESEHQYMATLHDAGAERPLIAFVKGSVEAVLSRCGYALDATGARVSLDTAAIERAAERMASRALRVLALARVELAPDTRSLDRADVQAGLTFLGLQGMIDPPREEAIAAVRACRAAGVDVKMITGDHAGTAAAIAERIGIGGSRPAVLVGRDLVAMSDAELGACVDRVSVFARVAPEHKLRLMRALQARGHIVAMTGDGVNDAPALKQADIGVAMGRGGTDVAKEASDMVLTDDNFASIAAAVKEGRGVFDNLRKFIVWTIPTNVGEGLVILVALVAGVALPILPLQILWINMTTSVLLGMTLAFEPKEPDVMARPPRDPKRSLLTSTLLLRTGLVSLLLLLGAFGLFQYELSMGASVELARTVATNVFVAVEALYLLNCRSLTTSFVKLGVLSNRWLIAGVALMATLQLLFTYAAPMNRLFGSVPIGPGAWLRIMGVAFTTLAVVGLEKKLRRRSDVRQSACRPLDASVVRGRAARLPASL
jgi:Ca2+-transporting ATPase